ncbi:MAG TPA: non-homologous end-joining DNA ligase [Streptosporangiaceae bacterium]|nr:non-homologous end-joining DNA ligase [Streptosporangiaceae bacterium]
MTNDTALHRTPAQTVPAGWVDPELATLTKDRFFDPAWMYERKFDGERCLAYKDHAGVSLMTRNRQRVNSTYPELAAALAAQQTTDFVIDGEVVAFEGSVTSFSLLQQRLGVRNPSERLIASVPVVYYLFDVLRADGRDVRSLPLRERKQALRSLLSFGGPLRFTVHRSAGAEAYWDQACGRGWEGLVVKRADSPYRSGRSRDWLKFKCENSQEFVIGGYTDPQGSRAGFGALLIGYYDGAGQLVYAGKVGTGFGMSALATLLQAMQPLEQPRPPFDRGALPRSGVHWIRPELVGQVGFSEWTSAGQLRHPRYLGMRRDKEARSVTRERPV